MLTQNEAREPKFLKPYTCPICGTAAEADEMYHSSGADYWRFTCPECGCKFKQWTATEDLPPTSLELDGTDYPLSGEYASCVNDSSLHQEKLMDALADLDDQDAVGVVAGWLQRIPDTDNRRTNLECIVMAMDKGTRRHIGEVFFDVDAEVGADEEG